MGFRALILLLPILSFAQSRYEETYRRLLWERTQRLMSVYDQARQDGEGRAMIRAVRRHMANNSSAVYYKCGPVCNTFFR